MNGPRRVLWLSKGLGRGGAEQLLVTTAAHLDRTRFSVEVAYLLPWKDALVPDLRASGIPVHCLDQRSATDARWILRLRHLLHRGHFDVVHTHMPVPAVAARLLAGRHRAVVHTEHNVWPRYRLPTRWANAVTYRRNDAVLAVSAAVADSIRPVAAPRPPATVEVLHHGVDHGAIAATASLDDARGRARTALGLAPDDFVVGTVGTMTPKKDQRTLLRAVALLRDAHPALRLVMVGAGPLEAALREEVSTLGLEPVVTMTGLRDDVLDLLPAFDVFCLSSLHEGLPIALVEAMASGVAPVCTRVGGVAEAVRDGVDGLLVAAADPPALAAALDRTSDAQLRQRLAQSAKERSLHFDITVATRRIESVYDEVLSRR